MRYIAYPQSCGARTVVEFGNTSIGFGGGNVTVEDLDKFLKETVVSMKKEKNTFCTAVLNNDQGKLFHQTFLDNGFACIQRDRYHPKYSRSISFYLLTLDWGNNPNYKDLTPEDGSPFVIPAKAGPVKTIKPAIAA